MIKDQCLSQFKQDTINKKNEQAKMIQWKNAAHKVKDNSRSGKQTKAFHAQKWINIMTRKTHVIS